MQFVPDAKKARREAILALAAAMAVAPLYLLWKGLDDVVAGAIVALVVLVAFSARAVFVLGVRGLDTLIVDDEHVHLSRKRASMTLAWEDIHRVYRSSDCLVFESTAPHRRYHFLLEGHEHHVDRIVEALATEARISNLRWVDELTQLT